MMRLFIRYLLTFVCSSSYYYCCFAFRQLHLDRCLVTRKDLQGSRHRCGELHALLPQENPEWDSSAISLAGVEYGKVLESLNSIYPPQKLDQRNAQSRTDGYWPYIQKGQDPPQQLTYGEYDFYFFAQLLDRLGAGHDDDHDDQPSGSKKVGWEGKKFVDLGSGMGRLVLAAATLHPNFKVCRGIELLESIHTGAVENLKSHCRSTDDHGGMVMVTATDDNTTSKQQQQQQQQTTTAELPMAPVEFQCGSFTDPYVYYGDADLIFVFSSCMSEELLSNLAISIGRQCRPGTKVITTEYRLPLEGVIAPIPEDHRFPHGSFQLELEETIDGWCWLTGGDTTAFVHVVKTSLWQPNQQPLNPPELTVQDKAYQVAMALERGELTDSKQFLRGVYNNMAFYNLPESFRPKLQDESI